MQNYIHFFIYASIPLNFFNKNVINVILEVIFVTLNPRLSYFLKVYRPKTII